MRTLLRTVDASSTRRVSCLAQPVYMLNNKATTVRRYVLDLLEQGKLVAGQQLPGARELALTLDISFLKVQQAIETLCQDGILEAVPRQGTFVQRGWRRRALRENLAVYDQLHRLSWMSGLLEALNREIGGLRMTYAFEKGMLEVRTTRHVLVNSADYMDIGGILEECYPDRSVFFERAMEPFSVNGRIVGIPISFSPRVIYYNPDLFRRFGVALPHPRWTWDEFMETVRALKHFVPAHRIIDWHTDFSLWINFFLRSGGRLFDPDANDPILFDRPKAIAGLRRFAELGDTLGRAFFDKDAFRSAFLHGEAAMHINGRIHAHNLEMAGNETWAAVPLPLMPDGEDVTAQATDLICVRNECTLPSLARSYVRTMLSEAVQDYLATARHNIPIRRSSALLSLSRFDSRDAVFAEEMGKISTGFNLGSPYPGALVTDGISQILARDANLEADIAELAHATRVWLDIQGRLRKSPRAYQEFSSIIR